MRQKDSKNTKTMILIYTVVGLIAYVVFLILYNKSREYIRYRELDLNEKQIQSIHMVDIQFMSTFLFIAVLLSFCLRLFSSSEFALINNSIKMIIGLVSAVVTTLVFYITKNETIRTIIPAAIIMIPVFLFFSLVALSTLTLSLKS